MDNQYAQGHYDGMGMLAQEAIKEINKRIEFIADGQGHHEIITGLEIARAIVKKMVGE